MRAAFPNTPFIAGLLACLAGFTCLARAQSSVIDSVSAVFRPDSAKAAAIRSVEAGTIKQDSASAERNDSLMIKQRHRGPYIGVSAGVSFTDNSAKALFADYMASAVDPTRGGQDSARVVQNQDPVQIIFPVGLVVGYPVLSWLDVWVRTEHFWSRVTGLTQRNNESPREFWYVAQGHLAGVGARYLVPVSLLSINGQPGLYAAYTHFWSFGPTGMYASSGAVRAKWDPAGAGYEIQMGYQQDYDKRFTFTGGLSFARLNFKSRASWKSIVPTGPDTPADWTLQALRFSLQGIYQFGK